MDQDGCKEEGKRSEPHYARLPPSLHPWLVAPQVKRLFQALDPDSHALSGAPVVQFVGGAIRDALLGRGVGDIDLATTLPPLEVIERLHKAHIKAIPTGLPHGTVTAVVDGKAFEITTLRRDVETHGRHATVAFTNDWAEDAARRDFTMNALYADETGLVTDYVSGLEDLEKGQLRFIGDASARIEEDVLRILRYFRFLAFYGRAAPEPAALGSCIAAREKLRLLSPERIWKELRRLLAASNPEPVLRIMADHKILAQILPEARIAPNLVHLVGLEEKWEINHNPLRRLAALLAPAPTAVETVAKRLRLSNQEKGTLRQILTCLHRLAPATEGLDLTPTTLRRLRYATEKEAKRGPDSGANSGKDIFLSALLLAISQKMGAESQNVTHENITDILNWEPPDFPLRGQDLLDLGIPRGPQIRACLEKTEKWWETNDFTSDKAACLAHAQTSWICENNAHRP